MESFFKAINLNFFIEKPIFLWKKVKITVII